LPRNIFPLRNQSLDLESLKDQLEFLVTIILDDDSLYPQNKQKTLKSIDSRRTLPRDNTTKYKKNYFTFRKFIFHKNNFQEKNYFQRNRVKRQHLSEILCSKRNRKIVYCGKQQLHVVGRIFLYLTLKCCLETSEWVVFFKKWESMWELMRKATAEIETFRFQVKNSSVHFSFNRSFYFCISKCVCARAHLFTTVLSLPNF